MSDRLRIVRREPNSALVIPPSFVQSTSPEAPTPEDLLRQMLPELDRALSVVVRLEAMIATQARLLANQRGLTVRPRIEQLRAEFSK